MVYIYTFVHKAIYACEGGLVYMRTSANVYQMLLTTIMNRRRVTRVCDFLCAV